MVSSVGWTVDLTTTHSRTERLSLMECLLLMLATNGSAVQLATESIQD